MFATSRRAFTLGLGAALPLSLLNLPARAQGGRNALTGAFDTGPGGMPGNFNPLMATAGFTWLNMYYDTLVLYDPTLTTISPSLATSMQANANKTQYTFKLPTGVTWHDGKPFSSADVKFTFDLARNKATSSIFASRLADVTSVEAPDATTAVVSFSKPNPGLPDLLVRLMMLPKHHLESIPADQIAKHAWWSTVAVGTGPFSFVKYETDQYVELKANPAYRLGRPKLDGVINRYFKTTSGAVAALRAGEIAFTYVDPDDAKPFAGKPDFTVIAGDSYVINYLGFNHATPLWKDDRVRQAVMHAINRPAIIESLYGGAARLALGCYVADAYVPAGMDPYAFDPAKAKSLLAAAGWAGINGSKKLPLVTYYNSPQVINILAAIQSMLGDVGIMVEPKAVDVPTYNAMVYAANPDHSQYPLVFAGLQNGPDPSGVVYGLDGKQMPPNGANIMRANFPELNAALDAAVGESDDSKRADRFKAVNAAFNKTLPWGPMWVATRYGVASSGIKGFVWTPAPSGGGYLASAEKWSL